jgi:hypothetical protein
VPQRRRHRRKNRQGDAFYVYTVPERSPEADICSGTNDLVTPGQTIIDDVDTNERPFQCPHCASTFGRLDTLLRHERTLHGSSSSAASNNPAHPRSNTMTSALKPLLKRSNSAVLAATVIPSRGQPMAALDPQLVLFQESPTVTQHHPMNSSSPTILGLSPLHHNSRSPLAINGSGFSPSNLLPANSSSIIPSTLHPTTHNASLSPMAESPGLWDSFTTLEATQPTTPSALSGDIQSQFSWLLFSLLPSQSSVPPTPGGTGQTPAAATPNLDSFIHSPSPMSFPLSSERGFVIPSPAAPSFSPTNSGSSYPPGSRNSFFRSLEDFDRGTLEGYVSEGAADVSLNDFELPKQDALNRYLYAYFEGMHRHHPFIHPATFNPTSTKGNPPI